MSASEKSRQPSTSDRVLLTEALPHLLEYEGQTIVIKYGGNAMAQGVLGRHFAHDVVLLKKCGLHPVVVHGGGPQINTLLQQLQITYEEVDGLRKTTPEIMEVVEMVLSGSVNKALVDSLSQAGGKALGLSCKDTDLIISETCDEERIGLVGKPVGGDVSIIKFLEKSQYIPVISPVSRDSRGRTLNLNGDTAAGYLAQQLKARRLLLLTSVTGVMDSDGGVLSTLSPGQAQAMMRDGALKGGMIPKIRTAMEALDNGVDGVTILDGRSPHALLLEIFTRRGAGTLMTREESAKP